MAYKSQSVDTDEFETGKSQMKLYWYRLIKLIDHIEYNNNKILDTCNNRKFYRKVYISYKLIYKILLTYEVIHNYLFFQI